MPLWILGWGREHVPPGLKAGVAAWKGGLLGSQVPVAGHRLPGGWAWSTEEWGPGRGSLCVLWGWAVSGPPAP